MHTHVLIINQDVNLIDLANFINASIDTSPIIITTHTMYPSEESFLRSLCASTIKIIPEYQYFTESEYNTIDERVCSRYNQMHAYKSASFMVRDLILEERARYLHEKLTIHYGDNLKISHTPDLGVCSNYWNSVDSQQLCISKVYPNNKYIQKFWRIVNRLSAPNTWTKLVFLDGYTAILKAPLPRIYSRINENVNISSTRGFFKAIYYIKIIIANSLSKRKIHILTTWHEYSKSRFHPIYVLQDGHLPRDYSASGIFHLGSQDVFVPSNPFSEQWAITNGRCVKRISGYSDCNFKFVDESCRNATSNLRILIALNHAGDWSPFIHRSDTDNLVLWSIYVAKNNPHIDFRIRPHPTMRHPLHEGVNSLKRIQDFVAETNLPNLRISTEPLKYDLNWTNIVISEYSQILIDAWSNGIVGISINITNRRSFMKEYQELGFPHTESAKEFDIIISDMQRLVGQQNLAVHAYNTIMNNWRSKYIQHITPSSKS